MTIEPTIWIDGKLLPLGRALIPVNDHSFLAGDGAFETLAVIDRRAIAVTRHLHRLHHSLAGLGLDLGLDDAIVRAALDEVIEANPGRCDLLRLTVSAGSGAFETGRSRAYSSTRVVIGPGTAAHRNSSVSVVTAPWPRNERSALTGLKTTSYAENTLALTYARNLGADEVLFSNTRGELCEGATSNVFVVIDNELITPPLSSGCLDGVTRDLILEALRPVERTLDMNELRGVTEAFLTSSAQGATPVTRIDNRQLPVGPYVAEARRRYTEMIGNNPDP